MASNNDHINNAVSVVKSFILGIASTSVIQEVFRFTMHTLLSILSAVIVGTVWFFIHRVLKRKFPDK